MSISNLQGVSDVGGVKISLPYLKAFKASDSRAGSSNSAFTAWDSVVGELAGEFNVTNGFFTPNVSGVYQIMGNYTFNAGAGSAGACIFRFAVAGGASIIATSNLGFIAGEQAMTVSGCAVLNAGTYYYLTSYQTVGAPLALTDVDLYVVLLSKVEVGM
jgi:hypothetical protein